MNYTLKSPLDVQIELTSSCNHKCRHCYNFWKHLDQTRTKDTFLSVEQLEIIFEQLKNESIISSTLTGGEPFIRPELVFRALEVSREAGIKTDINSNLTLIDEKIIARLSEFENLSILTSLLSFDENTHDFMTAKKGSFKKVIRNIKLCTEKDIKISVNMVLCKENLTHLYETAEFAKSIGAGAFCATRAVPPLGSIDFESYAISTEDLLDSLDNLIRIEKELGMRTEILGCYPKCTLLPKKEYRKFFSKICVAGKTTVTIGADGNVRPCSHSDKSYGNIISETLKEIWLRMDPWRDQTYLPEICKKCPLIDMCTCGCRVEAQHHGDISGMDRHAVPKNIEIFPQIKTRTILDVDTVRKSFLNKKFVLNRKLRFRDESFGGIIFLAETRNLIPVNTSAFQYLNEVFKEDYSISYENFEKSSGAKNQKDVAFVLSLFKRLCDKNLIKERR